MIIEYTNSRGVTIPLSSFPYWITVDSSLFDFSLKYEERYNKIRSIKKQIEPSESNVVIKGKTKEDLRKNAKTLYNVTAYDTENNTPGTLRVGDYYLECFVYSSKKNGNFSDKSAEISIGIVPSENVGWVKKHKYNIDSNAPLDFDYDHEYDMSEVNGAHVINDGFTDCDFEIEFVAKTDISGVSVGIGNNLYKVNSVLNAKEQLYINSVTKKIYRVKADGEIENCFNYRDRDNYIFTKIPTGVQNVDKYGDYDVYITLIQQRSEPEWI